jgi:hypothetical protein
MTDTKQVNEATQTAENLYYRDIDPSNAEPSRRDQHTHPSPAPVSAIAGPESTVEELPEPKPSGTPPYLFSTASSLIEYCRSHNLTIAQVVWENELAFRTEDEIREGLAKCAF